VGEVVGDVVVDEVGEVVGVVLGELVGDCVNGVVGLVVGDLHLTIWHLTITRRHTPQVASHDQHPRHGAGCRGRAQGHKSIQWVCGKSLSVTKACACHSSNLSGLPTTCHALPRGVVSLSPAKQHAKTSGRKSDLTCDLVMNRIALCYPETLNPQPTNKQTAHFENVEAFCRK
jgi:hypothetical protein